MEHDKLHDVEIAAALLRFASETAMDLTGAYCKNVEVVGYCDMQGRPAFKMCVREAGGRWYLYTGHFWHHGWSIVDVSDPANPYVERFIEGPRNTSTLQVTLFGDTMITALEKILPGFGGDADASFEEGVLIWDISDPSDPRRLSRWKTGGTGTHRNLYASGPYAHPPNCLFVLRNCNSSGVLFFLPKMSLRCGYGQNAR